MRRTLSPAFLDGSKVLVRVPNWVGDAVICLPALRALRSALPGADMTLLARPWVRDVFPLEELRARVISYDTQREHRGWRGRRRMAALLRAERFDVAILFQNALDAALLSWLAGIPLRAGYSRQGRRLLLTHPLAPPKKGSVLPHEAHYYLELLRRLGLLEQYAEVRHIALPVPSDVRMRARERLLELLVAERDAPAGIGTNPPWLVGISPGATFGTAKRWPAARFAELAARFYREKGAACIFFGSPSEQELAGQVQRAAGIPSLALAGRTSLAEFMHLIPGCDLFVTNDTGTMHVAAALGVPTLALFGPTNEAETRPLAPRARLIAGEAFCRPCKLRHCPIDHRCMNSISVERVWQAALAMLSSRSEPTPDGSPAPASPVAGRGETR